MAEGGSIFAGSAVTYRISAELTRDEYIQPPLEKNKMLKVTFDPTSRGFDNSVDTNELMAFLSIQFELKDISDELKTTAPYRRHNTGSTLFVKLQTDLPDSVVNQYIRPKAYTTKNNEDVNVIIEAMANTRTTVTIEGVQPEMTLSAIQKSLVRAIFFDPDAPENKDKDWPISLTRPKHMRADQLQAKFECTAEEVPHFVDMGYYKIDNPKKQYTVLTLKVPGRRLVCYDCGSTGHRAGHSACKVRRKKKAESKKDEEKNENAAAEEDEFGWKKVEGKDKKRRRKRERAGDSTRARHSQSEDSDSESDMNEMQEHERRLARRQRYTDDRERQRIEEQKVMQQVEEMRRKEREERQRKKAIEEEKKRKAEEEKEAKKEKDRQEHIFLDAEKERVRQEQLAQQQIEQSQQTHNKANTELLVITEDQSQQSSFQQEVTPHDTHIHTPAHTPTHTPTHTPIPQLTPQDQQKQQLQFLQH